MGAERFSPQPRIQTSPGVSPAAARIMTDVVVGMAVEEIKNNKSAETLQLLPGEVRNPLLLPSGEAPNPLAKYSSDPEFTTRIICGVPERTVTKVPKKNIFGKVTGEKEVVTVHELSYEERTDKIVAALPEVELPSDVPEELLPTFLDHFFKQVEMSKEAVFSGTGEITPEGQAMMIVALADFMQDTVRFKDSRYVDTLAQLSETLSQYKDKIYADDASVKLPLELANLIIEAKLGLDLMLSNHLANPAMDINQLTEVCLERRETVSEVSAVDIDRLMQTAANNFSSLQ